MTNLYLTDSDEEATVDFVKGQEELCDKTSEHFKDKEGASLGAVDQELQVVCLGVSRWFGLNHKGHITGPKGGDRTSDLDIGGIRGETLSDI